MVLPYIGIAISSISFSTPTVLKLSSCLWEQVYDENGEGIDTKIVIYINPKETIITDIQFSWYEEIFQYQNITIEKYFNFTVTKRIEYSIEEGKYFFLISGEELGESLKISTYYIEQKDYWGSTIVKETIKGFQGISKFDSGSYIKMYFEMR